MGREIKRVAMGWDFPLGETWTGYLCPFYKEHVSCPYCENGYSLAAELLSALWYGHNHEKAAIMLRCLRSGLPEEIVQLAERVLAIPIVKGRSWQEHRYEGWSDHLDQCDVDLLANEGRLRGMVFPEGRNPTPDEVRVWSKGVMFGLDSSAQYICANARLERVGLSGQCAHCDGEGHVKNPELDAKIEAWKQTEPPEGDGWQLWQTVSEGGPVSPVFASPEELAQWMAEGGHKWQKEPMDYDVALRFIKAGWAPSFVATSAGLMTGVEVVGSQ